MTAKRTPLRYTLLRVVGVLAVVAMAGRLVSDARGDSVVQFMTAKSLPDATVDVIDPESGTSTGTSGSDVNLAVGDIILFRFAVGSAPASAVRGIQAYVTEYVPPNTQLVGVRITDRNGLTIRPRRAGLALDGCSNGSNCNAVAGHQTGSIAQVYADTGVFFATAPFTDPTPNNLFLTLRDGIMFNPEPRNIDPEIVQLLNDTNGTYFAHNDWDWDQTRAFGGQTSPFANGDGNTPHLYGSPVAGPDTHYRYEASRSAGSVALTSTVGPWQRIAYPGSQIGSGVGDIGSTTNMTRVGIDTTAGYDLTPATAVGARAVRFALGEAQVGEERFVEVALRVTGVPIDPTFGSGAGNVDCGEAFGSDISSKSANTGGSTNPWPSYIGHPQCVFLRLKLDLTVDKVLATGADTLDYHVFGKNLSVADETNAKLRIKYVRSDQSFVSSTPAPDGVAFQCPGETNKDCLDFTLGTLAPSDEFTVDVRLGVSGTGGGTNVLVAQYLSTQLTAIDPLGYQATAMTVVQPVAAPRIALSSALDVTTNFAASPSPAGSGWRVLGTVVNAGTTSWTSESFTIVLPAATWGLRDDDGTLDSITVGGVDVTCTTTGQVRVCDRSDAYAPTVSRALEFQLVVPAGVAPDLFDVGIRTRGSQSVFGSFQTDFHRAVTVPVGQVRTRRPVLQCEPPTSQPIGSTSTAISGTSEPNADVDVLFNLIERGDGIATAAGTWTVANFLPAFGELYGGLEVRASAQVTGKLVSELSLPCTIVTTKQCSDGLDNDGDGAIDFPADPGCTSPTDNSEVDAAVPQCGDGIDNNGAGGTDWPADPSCSSATDATEDGVVAPPVSYRQCQDGIDNDGDGLIDFAGHAGALADDDCHSLFDDDESGTGSTPVDTRARLLIALDSSGSMNWNTCSDTFTGGDGSTECAGADVGCAACGASGCGNAFEDDSRLYKVKNGIGNVVAGFGEVEYSLMRFHQREAEFSCPTAAAGLRSGGWQGGGAAPCSGGFAAGDLLVSFAPDNEQTLLGWVNHDSDYGSIPPIGTDFEVRGSGTTPLAGILESAHAYLQDVQADDLRVACRPYVVILVTDGGETCGGIPTDEATELRLAGIPVYVIGFATPDPTVIANLNAIANAGGTTGAIFVSDEAALSTAVAQIIEDSILVETCNGLDDDCDVLIDEDFPDLGLACTNGEQGECFDTGVRVCNLAGTGTACDAPPGTPGNEVCNGDDDDCDGLVDEALGPSCTCVGVPEICNGLDDDCDLAIDEGTLPGEGDTCGLALGECSLGALDCQGGQLTCVGDTGPVTEVCNSLDDDCDTFVDEVAEVCYEAATGCDVGTGTCQGVCQLGVRSCDGNMLGECVGDVGPTAEVCNAQDDDCNGLIDDGLGLGNACDNGLLGVCHRDGVLVCDGAGNVSCSAPPIPPGLEVCNGLDDDCDGDVDEDLGAPIGDSCGGGGVCTGGTFQCVSGAIECVGSSTGTAEVCNGLDEDCDLRIDEDLTGFGDDCIPSGTPTYEELGQCQFGHRECVGGVEDCRDAVPPQPEIACNGVDENCDGMDDQTCPTGQGCVEDGCRDPCGPGEFPCGFGQYCLQVPGQGDFCVPDPCVDIPCGPGFRCDRDTETCVDLCQGVECQGDTQCVNGLCQDCFAVGCPTGELCVRDTTTNQVACVADLCFGVTCAEGEFCRAGDCIATTCEPACGAGERCDEGVCVGDPCADIQCPEGRICDPEDQRCVLDLCTDVRCSLGEACNPHTGDCVSDPCALIACPGETVCVILPDDGGTCRIPPPPPTERVFAGGGGCCSTTDDGSPLGTLLIVLGVGGWSRRRRPRHSKKNLRPC